jgi:hypothetical protein
MEDDIFRLVQVAVNGEGEDTGHGMFAERTALLSMLRKELGNGGWRDDERRNVRCIKTKNWDTALGIQGGDSKDVITWGMERLPSAETK